MVLPTPRAGHQTYDDLIAQGDLPKRWYLPDCFAGERQGAGSDEIHAALGHDNQAAGDTPDSEENETVDRRWQYWNTLEPARVL